VRLAGRLPERGEELSVNLRAPKEHGQILAVPALAEVGPLLERNRHLLNSIHLPSVGKSLSELRVLARREVLAVSERYHQDAGETLAQPMGDLWILAGHQPELFHPGVWFKNFALQGLARRHGALPLNLIVDTDSAKPALLHLPSDGKVARVPYDRSIMELPYEERQVQDEGVFAELPGRVAAITARWNFAPMFPLFWQEVARQAQRTPLLGERFAGARRAIERRWGCVQHEAPMSRICRTEAFAWFASSILARLLTFHDAYNQIVRAYRQEHGIRSRHHPVPDLTVDGEWLEAPFWAWRRGESRRAKLYVRRTPEAWTLRIGASPGPTLPAGNPARTVEAWRALEDQGIKIRSRALTTTMFARLFLADLFIHGIGGGIYDELTDRIIERYFEMPAPAFLVLSATLLLPLPRFPHAAQERRRRVRELRDLLYQPERFLPVSEQDAGIEAMIRAKQEWIRRDGATHAARVERFQRIREVNAQLHPHVQAKFAQVQAGLQECAGQIEQDETAARRDYAFCLYPEEMLREFYGRTGPPS
jgi:hypothetical protein